jgi:hypothetical protein
MPGFRALLTSYCSVYTRRDSTVGPSPSPVDGNPMNFNRTPTAIVAPHLDGTPSVTYPDAKFAQVATDSGTYTQFMRPKFARAPIKEAGRVAYLGWYWDYDSVTE